MWFDKFPSLVHLNLRGNLFDCIEGGLFLFLKNHRYLKSLRLSFNQIGEEIATTQGNSSGLNENNLESLEIEGNRLKGALPNWLVHFTNLKHIMLPYNSFSGSIPSVIGSLPNLVTLDLSYNGLNGTIPSSLGRLSSLRWLVLSNNQLAGHIPESLGKLRALQELCLDSNHLTGTIPSSFGKLSHLSDLYLRNNSLGGVISENHFSNMSRLQYLDVSDNNNLTFKAKPSWIPPFQLQFISMGSCKFITPFPQWIQTQVEAEYIVLSNASLFGPLPNWLANMTFDVLDLSHNQFTGHLPNISSNCSTLDLSHNLITGSLPTDIGVMYRFNILSLNDNRINGTIPSSLCDMELMDLNLANNNLYGSIPDCWKGSLFYLTLSFNKLSGVIPSSIGSLPYLATLHLNRNRLNGELPLALGHCTNLVILDLGENDFSGSIPTWLSKSFQFLVILRLRENRFTGSIPLPLCSLSGLQILDIAVNNLTGTIPRCLGYMHSMINFNQVNSFGSVAAAPMQDITSPPSVSPSPATRYSDANWHQEQVVEIIKGRYNEYTNIDLQLVVNLDLSSNDLIGSIPEELSFLSGLHGLNLSHNHLSGDILIGIGNMRSLESLDLSNNNLTGTIPQGISALTSLAHLNLSQNNLMGQIPKGNQIQTLDDPSIYAGNPLLCGDLLRKNCPGSEAPQPPKIAHPEDTHEEDKLGKVLFCAVVMLGFATGFWGFFGVLQFKKDWRLAYFRFADQAADKAYVAIVVKAGKLKRLRQSGSA
ncbi:receptor-like protein EIX1 [Syzygium oleosum]|uniref:receptor-like protein EIX1 n=1 Tax=Syzygium oleosum TaxID=219896 RepID=UPI0024BB47C4|nr:receptor-like protein EIX1 [Syzygium oleosum]